MLCLGIESSCDETALALYQGDIDKSLLEKDLKSEKISYREFPQGKLIGSVLASQAELHALFGGVVPELASREHYRLIGKLYDKLLYDTGVKSQDIDLISVARGPGLLGALLIGMAFAKALALGTNAKLIGVNHLEAHLLACGLEQKLIFPALGLLVSGGHTHIYRMNSPREFILLGKTLDDAAGEAFDKVSKLLNLPYPGGKWLDSLGQRGEIIPKLLPLPYLNNDNLNFSFSGLKTAVSMYISKNPQLLTLSLEQEQLNTDNIELNNLAASFNHAVATTVTEKLKRALLKEKKGEIKAVYLAGGVAANSFVRKYLLNFTNEFKLPLLIPSLKLCTDNAAMVAYTGWLLGGLGLHHSLSLNAVPKGQNIPDDYLIA
ncbi:tRNA (adenosine(37)-N6)-threonylcarbamoyltransferase complex transferase subunit TsaD [Desulfovibrio litoralis]|uniref:tRNA N6-adenosine threonylcarbamoyltransferase n=1 Tax=Desulfovibrio litoralis DSM 11393 TaxID=1121455 RepID=A0A1M7SRL9_9BACT|nr:tRNA (adenosine(37)-N6)-threonylcarbamoyltransferase complex transferase subunit TsaD [Desulfovibrio litoralis]SHN61058.1 O-sialoglycoprotein endopeptidase [Desulfovibrio litoralis DSM 11393]